MAETIQKPEVVRSVVTGEAVKPYTTAARTAKLTEKVVAIPLGTARVASAEMFRTVYAGIDVVEAVNQAQFKVVRELVHRVENLNQELIEMVESLATVSTGKLRELGESAGTMVTKTAAVFTRKKDAVATPA